ncbi:MAG: ABC transporter substrate-binding protein [Planctomycetes bacterium]|nr:ABC transporter substrate-binding protein [Planctomycetota bacterium]
MRVVSRYAVALALACLLGGCFSNNPYPESESGKNILYDDFTEEPKHLDPAIAYSSDQYEFINQIYEPALQYHYLKRPYVLEPLTATAVPEPKLYDKDGAELPADTAPDKVAKAVYEITLKPDIRYQPHPCFMKDGAGQYVYHLEPGANFGRSIEHPDDLLPGDESRTQATRALRAEDYVYQIKRLAHPSLECPIGPVLVNFIEGFEQFNGELAAELARIRKKRREAGGIFYNQEADEKENPIYLDMRTLSFPGVEVIDELTFRVTLKRMYPQFKYWLAMPFFAPIPWEADRFYTQSAASVQNITIDRFPVGTGPYMLSENRPNFRMVMRKNPNFHEEHYPTEGDPEDRAEGLLDDAGKKLPFLDEAVYMLEKEDVPRWNKFLQGYYDTSGIGSDVFDQAVSMTREGAALTDFMKDRGIRLRTSIAPTIYYFAFNMLDETVGGYDEKRKKLRQAISIAVDLEEFIQIFLNGRGEVAMSPLPPGIEGYQQGPEGINPVLYEWDEAAGAPQRKSIEQARKLLAEAGYPGGRDATGKALVLYYDAVGGGAGDKAYFDWLRKQFRKIDVDLQVRTTDYNQFQEKAKKGNWQILRWGWNADYPDPENFLFLLNGEQGKVKNDGENAANYDSAAFNTLFKQIENMNPGPQREAKIRQMLTILREDAAWIWGWYPKGFGLFHEWYGNSKPMAIGSNSLKYKKVDAKLRVAKREEWNRPVTWPVWMVLALLVLGTIPAVVVMRNRERKAPTI